MSIDERPWAVWMLEVGKIQRHLQKVSCFPRRNKWFQEPIVIGRKIRPKSGLPRCPCTTVREDRYLASVKKKQRFQNVVKVDAQLQIATGRRISLNC